MESQSWHHTPLTGRLVSSYEREALRINNPFRVFSSQRDSQSTSSIMHRTVKAAHADSEEDGKDAANIGREQQQYKKMP